MNFGNVVTEVYRVLQDPTQTAWPNSAVALYTTEAVRRVAEMTATSANRTTLSLVQGQQAYELPADISRLVSVEITPSVGGEPQVIEERDYSDIPVDATQEGEPRFYSLLSANQISATADRLAIFIWPPPNRSQTDSIILNVRDDFRILSDNPATAPQLAVEIPFPHKFDIPIIYMTIGGLLRERDDENDVVKGERYMQWAEDKLMSYIPLQSITSYGDSNRRFP